MDIWQNNFVEKNNFGTWLDQLIIKRGLNQSELAQKVGVNKSTISSLVSGRRGASNDLLIAIARVLRVSNEEMFQAYGLITDNKSKRTEFLVNRIMSLPESDQEVVEAFIDTMLERNEKKVDLKRKAVDS